MNIAYKMFHYTGNPERDLIYENAKLVFNNYKEFNTDTHIISSFEDYIKFVANNPNFKVDINGYNLDGQQGWRYGEIGIWASNWTAWNKFLHSEYDYLILMEDDLLCENNLPETIEQYIKECPQDFDALYINVPGDQLNKYNSSQDVSINISRAYQDWSCACYVVQKSTIKNMIDFANIGISLPLDWFMFRQQHLFKIYTVKPESYKGCMTKYIESTFQNKQERGILNGLL